MPTSEKLYLLSPSDKDLNGTTVRYGMYNLQQKKKKKLTSYV